MAAVPGIRPPNFCLPLGWLLNVSFISIIGGRGEWGGRVPDDLAQLEKHPSGGGCVWRQTS